MNDLISRQALRSEMYHEAFEKDSNEQRWDSGCWIRYRMFERVVDRQPSAQPNLQQTCNQLATDCISRQAAIEAIFSEPIYKSGMKKRYADAVVPAIYEKIKSLPAAQPERRYDEWCTDCKEYDQEKHCCPRWNRVIRTTLQDAQRTGRWIPVSERLPKINGQYLVTKTDHITNEHLIDIAFFVDWYQNNNGFYKADRVIAWMPLPEPFKEVE